MVLSQIRAHAEADPDRPLVVSAETTLTYGECLTRAETIAAGLAARSIDRFACFVADRADVVVLLCAAAAAGSEACVYPGHLDDAGVEDLASTFGHDTVVTDRPLTSDRQVVAPGELERTDAAPPPEPERAPLLVLTTGTTGRPKGARHEWGRLTGAVRRYDGAARERWLLAYNLNQFGGIQVLVHVIVNGATLVLGASNQPRDAVVALRDLGVTHASGTPTFWRFALTVLGDRPAAGMAVEQITLGGEAVRGQLLEDLQALFPDARISQIYGSAEAGTSISVRDGRSGLPASILERGDDAAVQLRIVDGELQTRSRVGMLGYADQDDDEAGWRPTGDLVELRGDRVHFMGRRTEIINVGGVKVHPLVVEELIAAVEGVLLVHVHGRANPMTGQIVAAQVVPEAGRDEEELEDAIREACSDLQPAAQPRRIRFVQELDVQDGKVLRRGATDQGDTP